MMEGTKANSPTVASPIADWGEAGKEVVSLAGLEPALPASEAGTLSN